MTSRVVRAPLWLDPGSLRFPPVERALREPNGLLAVGGDLRSARLREAYRRGIFPWYSEGQPILWWTPDPRAVLFPQRLKISRSLQKTLRNRGFTVTLDQAFDRVIRACAAPRPTQQGTWILDEIQSAFRRLHREGLAHSAECWLEGELVGGLYGVAIGRAFFGESMFARVSDASKVAFVQLVRQLERWGFGLVDCQIESRHLSSLGAELIPRPELNALLDQYCDQPGIPAPWRFDAEPPHG